MPNQVIKTIEQKLKCTITNQQTVGGGCMAQSSIIRTNTGRFFFLKQGFSNGLFTKEANGLHELNKAKAVRIPEVILFDQDFLLLECITEGSKTAAFYIKFGKALAQLHKYTSTQFGFYEDNFIGSTPQINTYNSNWLDFYYTHRLLCQFKLAEANGYSDTSFQRAFLGLEKQLHQIIGSSEEKPCLCHGDLWAGNYMVDKNGDPVLIDPAVYYGHREADLAMTKLFGGFSSDFYEAYQKEFPLTEGYLYRENIYLLYHVLNHLNLFGESYKRQAIQLMTSY